MVQLYYNHDVLVYPSEGEGFGLIPLQALATGMPTISTGRWCSYEKYLGSNVIESKLGKTQHTGYHTGEVILPEFDSLVELMRKVYEDIDNQCDFYYKQAPQVIKEYNWQKQCDKMLNGLIKRIGIEKFKTLPIPPGKWILFESGAGYATESGIKFSRNEPLHEVSEDEYDILIRQGNFRIPVEEDFKKHRSV